MSQAPTEETNSSLTAAQQFLDSIDADVGLSSTGDHADPGADSQKPADAKEIMSFIDEWTSEPNESVLSKEEKASQPPQVTTGNIKKDMPQDNNGGWASWGSSLWSQASAAVKAGTDQINKVTQDSETAKLLEGRVKDIQSFVNKENIGKIGSELRNLTLNGVNTLLDTVAPPLSDEEIVEIWLSKSQLGYLGLEQITYRAWSSVLEQTATGDVVVQTDQDGSKNDTDGGAFTITLHEGLAKAKEAAKEDVLKLAERHPVPSPSRSTNNPSEENEGSNEIRICPVFLSIQASNLDLMTDQNEHMALTLLLSDPKHQLEFHGLSQSIPKKWLDIPYEENEWVEEKLAKVLRLALTTIAQEYVWTRMNRTE